MDPTLPPLRHPVRHLRARLDRWWQARLPRTDHLTLNQHNVYILHTGAGLMLALTLLVLLVTPSTTSSIWATC